MADNYLEKRMEELRSGKLAVRKAIPGIRPKAQRVLVTGGCHGAAREKALEFRKQGCRVAVLDADEQAGRKMAYENGIRFHRVDPKDESALNREIRSLLSAWRGVDVAVVTNEICARISDIVQEWKKSLPIADNTGLKIVII
ncbi:MAG: SDR family NAD(P)-dependent oxidoreductase [Muribaculaceae bacterium]|nr:SDR family NAD(P)-dependent oxidoreductase [Muribaculaceae bacterium]